MMDSHLSRPQYAPPSGAKNPGGILQATDAASSAPLGGDYLPEHDRPDRHPAPLSTLPTDDPLSLYPAQGRDTRRKRHPASPTTHSGAHRPRLDAWQPADDSPLSSPASSRDSSPDGSMADALDFLGTVLQSPRPPSQSPSSRRLLSGPAERVLHPPPEPNSELPQPTLTTLRLAGRRSRDSPGAPAPSMPTDPVALAAALAEVVAPALASSPDEDTTARSCPPSEQHPTPASTVAPPPPPPPPPTAAPRARHDTDPTARGPAPATSRRDADTGGPRARQGQPARSGAGTVLLVDPLGVWEGRDVELLFAIRDSAPGVAVRSFRPYRHGFRVEVTDAEAFTSAVSTAAAFRGCHAEIPSRPPRTLEVTLTVPVSVGVADVLDDLRQQVGQEEVRVVRRLHASTDGRVDPTRPLPRVVVAVRGEEAAAKVRKTTLLGILACRSSRPRPQPEVTQCLRCFGWGHRAGACRRRRRCIRCGSPDHLGPACAVPREDTCCLSCGGPHAPTWRGCPARLRAARDLQRTPRPTHTTSPASTTSRPGPRTGRPTTAAEPRDFPPPPTDIKARTFASATAGAEPMDTAAAPTSNDRSSPPAGEPLPRAEPGRLRNLQQGAPAGGQAPSATTSADERRRTASPDQPVEQSQRRSTPETDASVAAQQRLRQEEADRVAAVLRTRRGPLADDLRALERQLEVANWTRLDARQEHDSIPCQRTKTALNSAAHRCARLRRRRRDLLLGPGARALVQLGPPRPAAAAGLSEPPPATGPPRPATAVGPSEPPPATGLGSSSTPPLLAQQPGQLAAALPDPPAPVPPHLGVHQAAVLIRQLRQLVRLASDPKAALEALDLALGALGSLLAVSAAHVP